MWEGKVIFVTFSDATGSERRVTPPMQRAATQHGSDSPVTLIPQGNRPKLAAISHSQ